MPLSEFLMGTPSRIQEIERFRPEQRSAMSEALQSALAGIRTPTAGFEPIAQEAQRRFGQETIPSIMERFSSMGAQRSSAFPEAFGQAGADLSSQLAALASQYGLQRQGLMQNLLGMGLTPQFEPIMFQRQPGAFESATAPFAAGLGALTGIGGMSGALGLINLLRSLFSSQGQQQPAAQFQQTQPMEQPVSLGYTPYTSPTMRNLMFLQGRI